MIFVVFDLTLLFALPQLVQFHFQVNLTIWIFETVFNVFPHLLEIVASTMIQEIIQLDNILFFILHVDIVNFTANQQPDQHQNKQSTQQIDESQQNRKLLVPSIMIVLHCLLIYAFDYIPILK